MVRCILFRFIRKSSHRSICRLRYIILVILVVLSIVKFFTHPLSAWPVQKIEKLFKTEPKLRHFSHNVSGQFTGHSNGASIPLAPDPRRQTPANVITLDIANTMTTGYLNQIAPVSPVNLGNQMFMYASLLGIADHARMTPIYPTDEKLRKIFKISASSTEVAIQFQIVEEQASAFDAKLFSLSDPHWNTTIIGYLQSWKYFSDIEESIRQEFTFNDDLRAQADEFLRNTKSSTSIEFTDVLFIGVHIRRGDMTLQQSLDFGYTVASKDYLAVAVNYFRTNFPASALVFVVCSDDLDWSKKNFPMVDRNNFVAFSENRTAAQDMAILAACNHTIITVGTYGWWSAYLAGGRTIYCKDFPTSGSILDKFFNKDDFFPPNWFGL